MDHHLGEPAPPPVVLAVDDEESVLRLLGRTLDRAGLGKVVTTADPREAAALFRHHSPDLVLLDLHMPGRDGLRVMEELRALGRPGEYLPMVVMSGDLTPMARRAALERGATEFIAKPLDPVEVVLRVRGMLETRALHRAVHERNLLLEALVTERTGELERARIEVLERLARAAEFRDDATGEHTRRVGRLAARIAREMGLDPATVAMLRRAAPLHDVGKIAIPDAVLRKPGALTAEERRSMEEHTLVGARLLAGGGTPLLCMAERIARFHHERWDGAGYPDGLAGEAIPLEARVVAVADVFDALTSDRPYRPAWPRERVLAEIAAGRGHHFDPAVADALLALPEVLQGSPIA
jgi:putative two-component system response regulator